MTIGEDVDYDLSYHTMVKFDWPSLSMIDFDFNMIENSYQCFNIINELALIYYDLLFYVWYTILDFNSYYIVLKNNLIIIKLY